MARFTPRKFFVHNGRRLSSVMSNAVFLGVAKGLYEALAADPKVRCVQAFGSRTRPM